MQTSKYEVPQHTELVNILQGVPVIKYKDLQKEHWDKINKPGTLSHSIKPIHLIQQLKIDQQIKVKTSRINDNTNVFLFVHLTNPDNNPRVLGDSYPGPFARSFGCALVLKPNISQKTMMPRLSNGNLKHILEPLLPHINDPWQLELSHSLPKKVYNRLKQLGYKFKYDEKFRNRILNILATTWNLRVYSGNLDEDTFYIDSTIGANIAQLKGTTIIPLNLTKRDIDFVVVK